MIEVLEFIQKNPLIGALFLLSGGMTYLIFRMGWKMLMLIIPAIRPVMQVAEESNSTDDNGKSISIIATLAQHIPKISSSLDIISTEIKEQTPHIKRLTTIDNRTLRTHRLLEQATTRQVQHYKKSKRKENHD